MARIRTIKPEFWTSEQIMDLSRDSRLLFVGMWNFCDDAGVHPASEKRLKAEVFPGDDITSADVRRMIDELLKVGLLMEYDVDSEKYWIVTGWHHQKVDQPTFKYPRPDGTVPDGAAKRRANRLSGKTSENNPRASDERSPNTQRTLDECSPPEGKVKDVNNILSGRPDDVHEVIGYLNAKAGRQFRVDASNTELVKQRLKDGATVDECKAVIDAKVGEWGSDEEFSKYLRPATLFARRNFSQYIGQLTAEHTSEPWEGGI